MTEDYTLNARWPLSEEQQEGVKFLLQRNRAVLNFQAGLGKTYTALTTCGHILKQYSGFKIAVICPAEAIPAWKRELTGKVELPFSIYTATELKRTPNALVSLFNYSSLHNFADELYASYRETGGKLIGVFDEAHVLANKETAQSQRLWAIRDWFRVIYALTATPLMSVNNIKGLYNLADYLKPGVLGTWGQFQHQFLTIQTRKIKKRGREVKLEEIVEVRNREQLAQLLEPFILVRNIAYNLQFHFFETKITEEEEAYYIQAGHGVLENSERESFAARLHDLQRVVDNSHSSLPPSLKKKLSSKERLFLRVLKQKVFDRGLSVIVYAEHLSTIHRLESVVKHYQEGLGLKSLLKITGEETQKKRNAVESSLQPGTMVLVTQAGTQSRNLQRANQLCVYDIPFAVGRAIQLVGRIARMDSQYSELDVYFLEAVNTVDTYKRALIQDNALLIKDVFGENPNLPDVKSLDRKGIYELRRKLLWRMTGKRSVLK